MNPTKAEGTIVFVCASEMRAEPNHWLLERAQHLGRARTAPRYELINYETFGALVEDGCTSVLGELYLVDAATLAALDRFEGHPTLNERQSIELEDGCRAQGYLLPGVTYRGPLCVAGGDWRSRPREVVAQAAGDSPTRKPSAFERIEQSIAKVAAARARREGP